MTTATKVSKRIHKVTIKIMVDDSPDTSWLGEYSNRPESEYSIDRAHSLECASQEYNAPNHEGAGHLASAIHYLNTSYTEPSESWDVCAAMELMENVSSCDCGESGDMARNEYRYFNPVVENYKGESPEDIRKYVAQDYARMESLNRGDWCFLGIRAEAEYAIGESHIRQEMSSGGLWGIESDSDKSYLAEVEQEQLAELREQLEGIGFSKRAVSAAFRNVDRAE